MRGRIGINYARYDAPEFIWFVSADWEMTETFPGQRVRDFSLFCLSVD